MKHTLKRHLVVAVECAVFALVLMALWLDEFIDLPHRLLGAPATPFRLAEYLFETATIVVVAIAVVGFTLWAQRRIRRLETFLRVCAWCRKVWIGDRWVPFEQYLEQEHDLRATHGMCEACHHEVVGEAVAARARLR